MATSMLESLIHHNYFAKLMSAGKMLLGYMSLVVFTVVVIYAFLRLQRMNSLNTQIIKGNIPALETAKKM